VDGKIKELDTNVQLKMKRRSRRSKEDWLKAALVLLEKRGVIHIKITDLARHLGTSRSGFYWHFKNKQDMLRHLLRHWAREYTEVISANPLFTEGTPRERLVRIATTIIDDDLNKYDLAFRSWARVDPLVANEVARVFAARMDYIQSIFHELGFEGDELQMRARLFVVFQGSETIMFWRESKSKMKKSIESRIRLLTQK
jgi:AcrR family transcriptional regulator